MTRRAPAYLLLALALVVTAPPAASAAKKALFDNTKAETAGNADWIVDTDQPIPAPDQSTFTPATPRTTWLGAISSWGVDLVKRGYTVHTLTSAYGITYQNASNPYDLSKYDVFVVPEPNVLFTGAEAAAIFDYVRDGGGLVFVVDHYNSDRNGDGYDSPEIWNALDPARLFGIHAGVLGDANNNIVQTSTTVNSSPSDSIIRGPVGTVTGLAFHNGTTFTLDPTANARVRGEVWMSGSSGNTNVMAASAGYGNGRVFIAGDSSPIDDGSAQAGNSSIYDGWGEAGATDSTLFMNATLWATRRAATGDVTAPTVSLTSPDGGETWKAGSAHSIAWIAGDDVGVTAVDLAWSADGGASFPNAIATGLANTGTYSWTVPDAPSTTVRVRVRARDAAGNAGADSSAADFTIDRWTIAASAGANGGISPSGAVAVAQGGSQSFTIVANPGCHVADVLVDASSVGAVGSYTFSNVTAGHTIAASFAPDQFTLATATVGGGSVLRTPDLASYPYGSAVVLDAVPLDGWAFAGWSGDTTGTADPLTLTVTANRAVTATFADVAAPTVALLAPVGGEVFDLGATITVRWSAGDNAAVDSVDVDWTSAGPAGPWLPVAHGLANTGSTDWTLPAQVVDSARVRVTARDAAGNAGMALSDSTFRVTDPTAGVAGGRALLALARPRPNPSRGPVILRFSLPAAGHARLEVVDAAGRRVMAAVGDWPAGASAVRWDGGPGAGLYFVRLATPWGTRQERLIQVR